MKKVIHLLVILLLLTGCAPATQSAEPWDRNLGTTTSNILMTDGRYAMANGFVYIDRGNSIVEYDMERGTSVVLPMPEPDGELKLSGASSEGTLFLLQNGTAYKQDRSHGETIFTPGEKPETRRISLKEIALLDPDGSKSTAFEEFGADINYFAPVKKDLPPDYVPDPNNPLAGLEFYYSATYDSFPEVAAQLAVDGITLPEPEDPVERGRYYIPALFHYDGDSGEKRILYRVFGCFFVDEDYIYVVKSVPDGPWYEFELFRSDRQEIDFQPMNLGKVGNMMCSNNGTLAFVSNDTFSVCLYDGENVRELPFLSLRFLLAGNKIVFEPHPGDGDAPIVTVLHIYDIDTGSTEVLSEHAHRDFAVLEDKYVAYREVTDTAETDILYDLETGERIEMYQTEVQ